MQTWLDHYISGALDSVVGTPLENALQRHTDLDAMRLMTIGSMLRKAQESQSTAKDPPPVQAD